jgi:hypothetical protein
MRTAVPRESWWITTDPTICFMREMPRPRAPGLGGRRAPPTVAHHGDQHRPVLDPEADLDRAMRSGNGGGVFDAVARAPPHSWPAGRRPSHRGSTRAAGPASREPRSGSRTGSVDRPGAYSPARDSGHGRLPVDLAPAGASAVVSPGPVQHGGEPEHMRRGDDQNPSALPVLCRQLAARTARADTRPPSPCARSQSPDTATSIWLWDSVPQRPARRF